MRVRWLCTLISMWFLAAVAASAQTTMPSAPTTLPRTAVTNSSAVPSTTPSPSNPLQLHPALAEILVKTQRIYNLIAESLETGVDPHLLFDVDLADENAVQIEVERLVGVIRHAENLEARAAAALAAATPPPPDLTGPVASTLDSGTNELSPPDDLSTQVPNDAGEQEVFDQVADAGSTSPDTATDTSDTQQSGDEVGTDIRSTSASPSEDVIDLLSSTHDATELPMDTITETGSNSDAVIQPEPEPESGSPVPVPKHPTGEPPPSPDAEEQDRTVTIDTELFAARVDLDRARLSFYLLPKQRREQLISRHVQRQRQDQAALASVILTAVEQKAKEAEAARLRAIALAQQAHSEAERLIEEERARLLGISRSQAEFEAELTRRQIDMKARAEEALTFRRRVRELLATRDSDGVIADNLYVELRAFLRTSRSRLAQALSESFSDSGVLAVGRSQLVDLPVDLNYSDIEKFRMELAANRKRLQDAETTFRVDHAVQLYDEVHTLNLDRLALLERLSPAKRDTITGFSYAGLDQAASEMRQVILVLRYHFTSARRWFSDVTAEKTSWSKSMFATGFFAAKLLLLALVFWWWRKRSGPILTQWRARLQDEARRARVSEGGRLYRFLGFFQQVRRPFEWLVLIWLVGGLLPPDARNHLEIRILVTIFTWVLSGSLTVGVINAIAGRGTSRYSESTSTTIDELRLRSMRLAGRTVVVLGLILALSEQLVGRGTIYSWVFSVCWFAAIPVVLIIIRWWRNIIFERILAARKKKAFEQWVIANQGGWTSFLAAVTAGLYLFFSGAYRASRNWLTSFELTRRAHAYLFRREMDQLAKEKKTDLVFHPLSEETFSTLGPETPSRIYIPGTSDDRMADVVSRINNRLGGVFAVVGERGRGKTTVLRQVRDTNPDIVLVDCPVTGLEGLRRELAQALRIDDTATIEDCAVRLETLGRNPGLIIDHVHHLIQPSIGGLVSFDILMEVARRHSSHCAWFFSFNEIIWRYFESARDARPLFDDVVRMGQWREEEISQLIAERCRQINVEPSFEHVMEALPAEADDEDRAEAHQRVIRGYYRMIWDYSAGNPGVALHTFRSSLGIDSTGRVAVKLFQVPDGRELDEMPEYAAFVLRAVIQLEPAFPDDIVRATMLRRSQVEDVLRYGMSHGYFREDDGRYRVTWNWFRPVTRFLQRRHLLASY